MIQYTLNGLSSPDGMRRARLTTADSFVVKDLIQDAGGQAHVRLARRYKTLPVIGGDIVVHLDEQGRIIRLTQQIRTAIELNVEPGRTARDAEAAALQLFRNTEPKVLGTELVVFARKSAVRPILAWSVLVSGFQPNGTPSREHLILEAGTLKFLDKWDDIHNSDAAATGKSLYSGTVQFHSEKTTRFLRSIYELRDLTRGQHYVAKDGVFVDLVLSDSDNIWGDGTTSDPATVGADVAYGQSLTWDYYRTQHQRNGVANDGRGAYSVVHSKGGLLHSTGIDNAWWDESCFCIHFGDGNTVFNPVVSIDIVGHEFTHGITSNTAGLIYSAESGGLNEATSDIFGSMIEFYAANSLNVPNYHIGERITKSGRPLRYMERPSTDKKSADCWFEGLAQLDVHNSSGVANHFFYLLAEGTKPSSLPQSPTCKSIDQRIATGTGSLSGIGRQKASSIWYRTLTTELTSDSNYHDAREASIVAAEDLFGVNSAEAKAVDEAWAAVNVIPSTTIVAVQCNSLPITNPNYVFQFEVLAAGTAFGSSLKQGYEVRWTYASNWAYATSTPGIDPYSFLMQPLPTSCPADFVGDNAFGDLPAYSPYHNYSCIKSGAPSGGGGAWNAQFSNYGTTSPQEKEIVVALFDSDSAHEIKSSFAATCP